jgi:hypothetical protein
MLIAVGQFEISFHLGGGVAVKHFIIAQLASIQASFWYKVPILSGLLAVKHNNG